MLYVAENHSQGDEFMTIDNIVLGIMFLSSLMENLRALFSTAI